MAPLIQQNLTVHLEEREARALIMAGSRVVRWASLTIPSGVISAGVVVNPSALADVLRKLLQQVRGGTKPVVSLSGLHPVVRMLNLPRLKRELLAEAIDGAMRRELPSPIEHYQMSWMSLEASKTECKVYVLAVPLVELESYMVAFKEARLSPRSINLEALAVASVLGGGDAIIVGIKDTGFSIVVVREGIPAIMRDVTYAQENLPMVDRVTDLRRELQLTLASFGSDRPDDPIVFPLSTYLIGKNTNDDYLISYVSQEVGFQASSFQPPAIYPEGFPIAEYAANLGLALRGRKRVQQSPALKANFAFDLVPERFRPRNVPVPQAFLLIGVVVGLATLIGPLRGALQPAAESLQLGSDIVTYQRGIDQAANRLRAAREAEASLAKETTKEAQLEVGLQQIASRHLLWPTVIEASLAAFPTIEALTVSESPAKIDISARAPNAAEAVDFAAYLKKTGLFSSVTIPSLTGDTQGEGATGVRFNLIALIASKGG